jgi:pilus assembly protein CpaB
MRRRSIGLVIAVLLAAGGAVALITYARSSDEQAGGDASPTVLVAAAPIASGTSVTELPDLVTTEEVASDDQAAGAISSLAELEGLRASANIATGEQLTRSMFSASSDAAESAAVPIPPQWLTVSLELDSVRSLSGGLRSGDSVAVIGSFSPFQEGSEDIPPVSESDEPDQPPVIAAVDESIDSPTASGYVARHAVVVDITSVNPPPETEEWAPAAQRVMLALPPDDVEQVVFAAEFGTIWLALDPLDSAASNLGPQTRDSIFQDDSEVPTPGGVGS